MGFLSSIGNFLGGGSSTTTAPSTVWGNQVPYLDNLYNRAKVASYGGMGQNYATSFLPGANRGFDQLVGGGQQFDPTGLQNIATGQTQNQNLGGAIQAGLGQINRNFQRNIMPGINQGAAMTNTAGGSRQGIAQGLAMSDTNQQASDFVQRMMSQNYQSGIQNQLGAYGQLGQQNQIANQAQLGALGVAPALSNLGFGAQYGDLSQLYSLIGRPTVLGGGSQSESTGGLGGLGGAAQLGALGYLAFSDVRLKENIRPVGMRNGLPVYSYNYKGDNTPQVGVIAQDVEITKPEAVKEIAGYKAVDYGAI